MARCGTASLVMQRGADQGNPRQALARGRDKRADRGGGAPRKLQSTASL